MFIKLALDLRLFRIYLFNFSPVWKAGKRKETHRIFGSLCLHFQVWKLAGHGLMHAFSTEHAKQSIFRNIGAGVMQVETRPGNRIFTCGADGTLKMRVLPDRYNIPSSLVDAL